MEHLDLLKSVGPFVAGTGQFLFDVFVGTLDLAYGVYDGIRQTIGNLFGLEINSTILLQRSMNFWFYKCCNWNCFAAISKSIGSTWTMLTQRQR